MKNKKLSVIIPTYNQEKLIITGLKSIPGDERIEIIIVNDGSTDRTEQTVLDYIAKHKMQDIKLFGWNENKGVSYAVNKGLDEAQGEYEVLMGSDGDYFLPNMINKALNEWLQGEDLVFFDLIDNTGHVRRLRPETPAKYPGAVKFMRREFVGNTRCPLDRRRAEDVVFTRELLAKNPKMKFLNRVIKHYNYPRKGSLTWNARHGVTDKLGFELKEGK